MSNKAIDSNAKTALNQMKMEIEMGERELLKRHNKTDK